MTTMLEKMAEAIEAKVRPAMPIHGWDATEIARAALEAIRDLDSDDINGGGLAALVAGKRALHSCSAGPDLQDARGCFHTMIDAILEELAA